MGSETTEEDDKILDKSETTDTDLASKSLSIIVSDSSETDDSALMEETARLKNQEINEALGIIVSSEAQTTIDTKTENETEGGSQVTVSTDLTGTADTFKPQAESPVAPAITTTVVPAIAESLDEYESITTVLETNNNMPLIESSPEENSMKNEEKKRKGSVW